MPNFVIRGVNKTVDSAKITKMVTLNVIIALVNVFVFSKGLIGVQIVGGSALGTAFGVTIILMSLIVFFYGNYKILLQKNEPVLIGEIKTPEECIHALRQNNVKKTFSKDIVTILEQTDRFSDKKKTIKDILLQKFSSGEMSYSKFEETIKGLEEVFYINIKSILNRLNAFDEADYNRMQSNSARKKFTADFIQTKMEIYNEYIAFVKDAIEDNEQILLKLDKLLFEISKFNSLEDGEIEHMSAMKEIDELIKTTKLYK